MMVLLTVKLDYGILNAVKKGWQVTMEMEAGGNRKYKDSVFTMYIGTPERLIEVYNAVQGTKYPLDTPIEINTLDGVLFTNRMNDISFILDGRFIVLIEHQSSLNENMPVRMLLYLGRLYEKVLEKENIYRKKRISLPTPEFLVLYNGRDPFPKESYLKLSDSFTFHESKHINTAELIVKVVNIQYRENQELLEKSKSLYEYSFFIDRVQDYSKKGYELRNAIRKAALDCEKMGIMQPFLKSHISEVENMLFTEWKMEDALKIEREEGREEGIEEGIEKERRKTIQSLAKFIPAEQIAKMLELPIEEVRFSLER